MTNDNEILETAKLGIEAEAFLSSPLGKELFRRAEKQIMDEVEKLVAADPDDAKLGYQIRNRIVVAETIMKWIVEVINDGKAAHYQLRQDEEAGES